ncbi:MAG: helix-turn-helix transcriptional regulator [Hyphomicrobiaceae bacterium]|nr:helix-turn-helix transcriptional regulator [Hyphomicrobiaceae bacterium]
MKTKAKAKAKAGFKTKSRGDEAPPRKSASTLATVSGAPVVRSLEQAIGNQVRDYRKTAHLTVSELAHEASISTGMLSKIENGQISASLGVLQDLAAALNIKLTDLLRGHEKSRGCSFVKAGSGTSIRRRGTKVGHDYQLLGQSVGGDVAFEPYLITLSDDAEVYTEFRHEGVEFIYMLTGEVAYIHGDQSYRLTPGDSLLFDSAELHGPGELIKMPISYLSIIVYRR